jgi:hypothetical protein
MKRYKVEATPSRVAYHGPNYTASGLAEALGRLIGEAVIEVASSPAPPQLRVDFRRETADEALEDLRAAVAQLGLTLVEAEVSEMVDHAVEGMLIGFLGGGTTGSRKNPYIAFLLALAGAAAGAKAGSMLQTVAMEYTARFLPGAGWARTDGTLIAAQNSAVNRSSLGLFQ